MRAVAAVSGIYDATVGVVMLAGRPLLAHLFRVALPTPPIHADLNGLFLLSIAMWLALPWIGQASAQQPQITPELAVTRAQRDQANNEVAAIAAALKAAQDEVERLKKLCGEPCKPKSEEKK